MKKIIPLLLALTLLLSLGVTALADGEGASHTYESTTDTTKLDQKITTTIPEDKILWHLEIPATVVITEGGYADGRQDVKEVKIVVDKGTLSDTQKIEAYLEYDGQLFKDNSAEPLPYVLSVKNPEYDGSWEGYATLKTGEQHNVGNKTKDSEKYDAPDAWVKTDDWRVAPEGDYAGAIIYTSKLVDSAA